VTLLKKQNTNRLFVNLQNVAGLYFTRIIIN